MQRQSTTTDHFSQHRRARILYEHAESMEKVRLWLSGDIIRTLGSITVTRFSSMGKDTRWPWMINLFPAHFLGNEKIKIAEQGGGSNSSWPWDLMGVIRFWDREECLSVFQGRMITDWSSGWCESIWKESDLSSVRGEIILSISNEFIPGLPFSSIFNNEWDIVEK